MFARAIFASFILIKHGRCESESVLMRSGAVPLSACGMTFGHDDWLENGNHAVYDEYPFMRPNHLIGYN